MKNKEASNVEDLFDSILSCHRCYLSQDTNIVIGEGEIPSPILILAEAPGKDEESKKRPLIGPSGTLFRRSFSDIIHKSFLTNTVLCRPPSNQLDDSFTTACNYNVWKLIRACNPDYIVTLGRSPYNCVTMNNGDIMDKIMIEKEIPLNGKAVKVLPILHPAFITRRYKVYSMKHQDELAEAMEDEEWVTMVKWALERIKIQ